MGKDEGVHPAVITQTLFRFLILSVISLLFPSSARTSALGFSCLILLPILKKKEFLICLGFVLLCLFQAVEPSFADCRSIEGRVSKIYTSGFVVQGRQGRFVVKSEVKPHLDDYIAAAGRSEPISGVSSFYGFDQRQWAYQNRFNGRFKADTVSVVEEGKSIRNRIHKKISKLDNPQYRSVAGRVLLGINDPASSWNLLYRCGFQYSLLLQLATIAAGWFICKENLKTVRGCLLVVLCLMTRFSYPVCRLLILELFQWISFEDRNKRWIFKWMAVVAAAPCRISSASFLFPFVFSLYHFLCRGRKERVAALVLNGLMQSLMFHQVNLFLLFFGFLLRYFMLFSIFSCILAMVFPPVFPVIVRLFDIIEKFGECFPVYHGQISAVLVLLVLAAYCFPVRFRMWIFAVTISIVFISGLWHPLASVTFINVGQGDSILIRMPYNQTNILIDTGRPSAYPLVKAMLDGEGIRQLDALIVTHDDEDHCGNVEQLKKDYHPLQVIEKTTGMIHVKDFMLYNFNKDTGILDSNPGSMVLLIKMDDLTMILSGDAPASVEEDIVRRFPQLKADILKIGHHGSHTSSCSQYLTTLQPQLAINSSGVNNRYRHPHPEVVNRLASMKIPLIDTQNQGDIRIIVTRFFKYLFTAERGFVIIR